jgi:hypothetical protein
VKIQPLWVLKPGKQTNKQDGGRMEEIAYVATSN